MNKNESIFLKAINPQRNTINDVLYALNSVRTNTDASINPDLEIICKGEAQIIDLDTLLNKLTGVQPDAALGWDGIQFAAIDDEAFYKGLADEFGEDLKPYLQDTDSYDYFVIEKGIDKSKLIKKTKLIHRGGKTFFATYWVNPRTGEKLDNEKVAVGDYTSRHEEFAVGDQIKFFNKRKGRWEIGTVKAIRTAKAYPEGIVVVSTADDPEIGIGLKSARGLVKVLKDVDEKPKIDDKKLVETKIPEAEPSKSAGEIGSLLDLTSITSLGGSSDVKLYKFTSGGNSLTVKTPRTIDGRPEVGQLQSEVLVDNIYKMYGFGSPGSAMATIDGVTVKVAPFIPDAKQLATYTGSSAKPYYEKIRQGFVLDALLGNWDVIGANKDNILIDDGGQVIRVDNGGSLFYRARGGKKPDGAFGSEITELETFLDKGRNPVTAEVYKDVSESDIKRQAEDIIKHKKELFELISKSALATVEMQNVANAVMARVDWLEKKIKEPKKPPEPVFEYDKAKFPSKATSDYFTKGWDALVLEGNVGIKDTIKKNILKIEEQYSHSYKRYANEHKMTIEEYKIKCQEKVEKMIGESDYFRATDINYLEHILLTDGRYKSQFETRRSDGSYSPDSRSSVENRYFGFPDSTKTDVEKRPIYGYCSNSKTGAMNSEGRNPPPNTVAHYGQVTVKIKKEVALRKGTVTYDDSLGRSGSIVAVPVAKPHFTMFNDNTDILSPRIKQTSDCFGGHTSYTEVQYHNQLGINDIAEIMFSPKNYHGDTERSLTHMNKMISIARETKIPITIY